MLTARPCNNAGLSNGDHPSRNRVHNIMTSNFASSQVQPFSSHKIEPPSNKIETSLDELKAMYTFMYRMRRMEIAADMMYKAKLIRGFCHL